METTVRKTFKYQLLPTPQQAQTLEQILWRCRELYNASLEERKTAWEKRHVAITSTRQSEQLPDSKGVRSEYGDINAQALQDVLHRLDKAFAGFFRRVHTGDCSSSPSNGAAPDDIEPGW